MDVVGLLALIIGFAALYATAIAGSIDALAQPREVWGRAGFRRSRWVWQALGVLFLPGMLVYSGLYFVRVRPRLVAIGRELAVERGQAHRVSMDGAFDDCVGTRKIRMPTSLALAAALPGLIGAVIGFGLGALSTGSAGVASYSAPLVGWGVTAIVIAAINLAFGVTLTPHELIMRGLVRRRVLWADVVAITPQSQLGTRYVRLWTRTGRARRLRAPTAMLGLGRQRFDADVALLERWWWTHAPVDG